MGVLTITSEEQKDASWPKTAAGGINLISVRIFLTHLGARACHGRIGDSETLLCLLDTYFLVLNISGSYTNEIGRAHV